MTRRFSTVWCVVAVTWCAASMVRGQAPVDISQLARFERQIERIDREREAGFTTTSVPVGSRAMLDYGASVTYAFLALDDALLKSHELRQFNAYVYANLNIDRVHAFFLRVRATHDDFSDGDSFDGRDDDWVEPTLDRATYSLNVDEAERVYGDGSTDGHHLRISVGRDLVTWGTGLTLSWEIDGAQVTFGNEKLSVTALAGLSRDSVVDIDTTRPRSGDDTERFFLGALARITASPRHQPYAYVLRQVDGNDDVLLATVTSPGVPGVVTTTAYDYESYYLGLGTRGVFEPHWVYQAEVVYEGGTTLSSSIANGSLPSLVAITQTRDDISAWAGNLRLDYLVLDPNNSRFTAEFIITSGDDDRLITNTTLLGNQAGTTDRAFNGFGLLNTGLAFAPALSNITLLRAGASTYPLAGTEAADRLQVGMDHLFFFKTDEDAPIDEASVAGEGYLGYEIDLYTNWQILSDLAWVNRLGVFFPGAGLPGSGSDPRLFFYTGVTLAF